MTHLVGGGEDPLASLVATARAFGVEDVIVDSYPRASTIPVLQGALDELGHRGITLPKRLIFSSLDDDRVVASYQDVGDRLTVNTASRFWNDPAGSMSVEAASGFLVSDDPLAIVYHEIGHALHRGQYRLGWRWWSESSRMLREHERTVAQRVSRYAMEDVGEFVAEVVAGRLAGRKFDEEVLRLYKDLKGPNL